MTSDAVVLVGFIALGTSLCFLPGWVAAVVAVTVIVGTLVLCLVAVMGRVNDGEAEHVFRPEETLK